MSDNISLPANKLSMVYEFHKIYGAHIGKYAELPSTDIRELRRKLLAEEFDEYIEGEDTNDLIEIADALGDMLYIIYGTAVSYGLPINEIFNEIHRSNMSKLDAAGKPIRRDDGKILKGPNYFKPDIASILSSDKYSDIQLENADHSK